MRRLFCLLFLVAWCVSSAHAATISGPDAVEPGILGTFEADVPGQFLMIPANDWELAVDSNGQRAFFATTREGQYTLVLAAIENGQVVTTTKTVTVGKAAPQPEPKPAPEPQPEPQPTPQPEPVKKVQLNATDAKALADAAQATLDAIADGSIRTPQGARAKFKNTLWASARICSPAGCYLPATLNNAIGLYEKDMDLKSIDGIKAGMETIVKEQRPNE